MAILYSKNVVLLTIFACLLPGSRGTDNCQGICMHHYPVPTTAAPPRITTTSSTESIKSTSTTSAPVTPQASWRQSPPTATRETITMATSRLVSLSRHTSGTLMTVTIAATSQLPSTTKVFETGVKTSTSAWTPIVPTILPSSTITTVQSKHAQQPDKDDSKVYIVAASLGTVLFLALTALSVAVAFLLKYKKRREKDTRDNISMNAVRGEAEELILNPADRGRQQRLSNEEGEYADLDTHTMATPNGNTYASLLRSEGGNNLEESSAIYLFPRSGKGEEPLSPVYVNQIPTPTYENI